MMANDKLQQHIRIMKTHNKNNSIIAALLDAILDFKICQQAYLRHIILLGLVTTEQGFIQRFCVVALPAITVACKTITAILQ